MSEGSFLLKDWWDTGIVLPREATDVPSTEGVQGQVVWDTGQSNPVLDLALGNSVCCRRALVVTSNTSYFMILWLWFYDFKDLQHSKVFVLRDPGVKLGVPTDECSWLWKCIINTFPICDHSVYHISYLSFPLPGMKITVSMSLISDHVKFIP